MPVINILNPSFEVDALDGMGENNNITNWTQNGDAITWGDFGGGGRR